MINKNEIFSKAHKRIISLIPSHINLSSESYLLRGIMEALAVVNGNMAYQNALIESQSQSQSQSKDTDKLIVNTDNRKIIIKFWDHSISNYSNNQFLMVDGNGEVFETGVNNESGIRYIKDIEPLYFFQDQETENSESLIFPTSTVFGSSSDGGGSSSDGGGSSSDCGGSSSDCGGSSSDCGGF